MAKRITHISSAKNVVQMLFILMTLIEKSERKYCEMHTVIEASQLKDMRLTMDYYKNI